QLIFRQEQKLCTTARNVTGREDSIEYPTSNIQCPSRRFGGVIFRICSILRTSKRTLAPAQ
ncbi:MAG: hypothetical protein NTW21_35420, partial [Verrucomicrobia bacterium]|nr:hypothetical protein [Verrucomicrobiota bacterium]